MDDVADVDSLKKQVLTALKETKSVLAEPPPETLATDVAGKDVTLRIRWWVQPPTRSDLTASQDEALAAIRQRLAAMPPDQGPPFPGHLPTKEGEATG